MNGVEILQGLGYTDSAEKQNTLMGALMKMTPQERAAAAAQIANPRFGSLNKSIRDLVMERADALPTAIYQGLVDKRLQVVEAEYYSVKHITGVQTQEYFEHSDKIFPGWSNLNNGKLNKDEWFLLTAIQYQEGIGSSPTSPFSAIFTAPSQSSSNGDFNLTSNGNKYLVAKDSPISMFNDVSLGGGYKNRANTIAIENPKWIEPEVKITAAFRCATAPTVSNTFGKIKLIGAQIIPY